MGSGRLRLGCGIDVVFWVSILPLRVLGIGLERFASTRQAGNQDNPGQPAATSWNCGSSAVDVPRSAPTDASANGNRWTSARLTGSDLA